MGGDTWLEAVERWERVLDTLEKNNVKMEARKTFCFARCMDLLGWTKKGRFLIPDKHRQNTLLQARRPTTIKELRSFLGTFHTFHKCMKRQSEVLGPLTKILSGSLSSSTKIQWTEELNKSFEEAKKAAADLDEIYTTKKDEQLLIQADYAEKGVDEGKGISGTLWAVSSKDKERRVVARMSAELQPQQENLSPCDGEATAIYVAAKSPHFSTAIQASTKRTICLTDNKPVVEAASLLQAGKFSTS